MRNGVRSFREDKGGVLSNADRMMRGTSPIFAHDSSLGPRYLCAKGVHMANQMGKRYMCGKCGLEVIITKAGGGTLVCCGQDMVMKK
jgi:desulfoferrodoxin-like iron-binding protein